MGGGPVATYIKPVTSPPLCPWGRYPSGGTHRALDYPVVTGTKFRVARAGVVKVAGWSTTGFGNHIRVLLDDGNTVIYGHLSRFLVSVGQKVTAGQFIGETGNSGNSTGPHLHMEVRRYSTDPLSAWDFTSRLVNYQAPTTTTIPTPTEKEDMPLSDDDIKRIWNYKNVALTGRDAYDLLRRSGVQVWDDSIITRDGKTVSVKQDLANTGTTVNALVSEEDATQAQISALGAKLETLTAAVANLVALIQESHPKAEPEPPAQPVPAYGVDVSGHQTIAQVTAAAADERNAFVIAKATEGQTWKSPDYAAQREACGAKFLGAYHFAWPNQNPLAEAGNFEVGAGLQPGQLACLDMERSTAGESWATRVAYAIAWCDEVKRLTGATPIIYVNWNWIKGMRTAATLEQWERLTAYPLWLAEWTGAPGEHSTVTAKDGSNDDDWPVVLHQYGVIDNLDRNWTPDLNRLMALGVKRV